MVRCLAAAVIITGVMATAAAAQQTIGVSAVILERIEPGTLEVEVVNAGSRLSVREAAAVRGSTRLIRSTFVNGGRGNAAVGLPERLSDDGMMRLERAADGSGEVSLLERGARVDDAGRLTITRVVAANS